MLKENNKIQAQQNIFDLANISLGGLDNIMTLIQLNPEFESIDVNLDAFAGDKYKFNDDFYQQRTYQLQLNKPKEKSSIQEIRGKENQSVFDLCLMAYGTLDLLMKFIEDNIFDLNNPIVTLKSATFDSDLINDGSMLKILSKKGYVLAAGMESFTVGDYRITDDLITRLTDNLDIRVIN